MPFVDLIEYLAAAREDEQEAFRRDLKASAFVGYQLYLMTRTKDSKTLSFMEYSDGLGLLSKEEKDYLKLYKQMEKLQQKNVAKQAIANASNILQMDRSRRKGG